MTTKVYFTFNAPETEVEFIRWTKNGVTLRNTSGDLWKIQKNKIIRWLNEGVLRFSGDTPTWLHTSDYKTFSELDIELKGWIDNTGLKCPNCIVVENNISPVDILCDPDRIGDYTVISVQQLNCLRYGNGKVSFYTRKNKLNSKLIPQGYKVAYSYHKYTLDEYYAVIVVEKVINK